MRPRSRERPPRSGGSLPPFPRSKKKGRESPGIGKGRGRIEERKGTENAPLRFAPPAGGGYRLSGGPYPGASRDKGGLTTREPRGTVERTGNGSPKIFRVNAPRRPRARIRILGNTWYDGAGFNLPTFSRMCVCTMEADDGPAFAPHGPTATSEVLPTVSRPDGLLWAFVTFSGMMDKRCR